MFLLFISFALLFYGISGIFGGGTVFKTNAPVWLLVSRDVAYFGLLSILAWRLAPNLKGETWASYSTWLKWFIFFLGGYCALLVLHSCHRSPVGILQHELRNTIGYSAFLFLFPFVNLSKNDWGRILKIFLTVGVFQSFYALVSRYFGLHSMTWGGRVTGTMADPNNFSVFIALCVFILLVTWEEYRPWLRWPLLAAFLLSFTMAGSVTGLGVLLFGLGLIWSVKWRTFKGLVVCTAIAYSIFLFSMALKVLENRQTPVPQLFAKVVSVDRYLTDKLDNISGGGFSKLFFWGLRVSSDDPVRTLTRRQDQAAELTMLVGSITLVPFLVGDLRSSDYRKFDNQYLNLFINTGISSILIILAIFAPAFYLGYKNWSEVGDQVSLVLWVFLVSLFLVGFNGSALFNRFPLNFLSYLFFGGVIMLYKERSPS